MAATDTFTRADNADLGASWDVQTGHSAFKIVSNAVQPSSLVDDCAENYNGVSFANDQYSQAVLPAIEPTGLGTGCGVAVRMSAAANTSYQVICNAAGTELKKFVAGSVTSLATDATAWANGDTVKLEVSGASPNITLVVKRNGSTISALTITNETSIASGRAGICFSSSGSAGTNLDTWEGGDLAGGGATPAAQSTMTMLGVQ